MVGKCPNHYLLEDSAGLTLKLDEISKLVNSSKKGYLLEVDVCYPRELHDYHNDLPFMCGCMAIKGVEKLILTN